MKIPVPKFIKNIFIRKKSDFKIPKDLSNITTLSGFGGLSEEYLFDFLNYSSLYNGNSVIPTSFNGNNSSLVNNITTPSTNQDSNSGSVDNTNENDKKNGLKIKVKPIDVLNQLETIPTPFDLILLDEKIKILKQKEDLITQEYSKREVKALIERLENRKKYTELKDFFERFDNTNDEKIDALLNKYDLVMKTSDIFIPEFPDDAIKVMSEYTEVMKKLCGKKPVFYVIAEEDKFKKAFQRRDPILLVQSPFGFYWQILGAWDKEMLLLHEL